MGLKTSLNDYPAQKMFPFIPVTIDNLHLFCYLSSTYSKLKTFLADYRQIFRDQLPVWPKNLPFTPSWQLASNFFLPHAWKTHEFSAQFEMLIDHWPPAGPVQHPHDQIIGHHGGLCQALGPCPWNCLHSCPLINAHDRPANWRQCHSLASTYIFPNLLRLYFFIAFFC